MNQVLIMTQTGEAGRGAGWLAKRKRAFKLEGISDLKRINDTSWEVTGENPAWEVTLEGGVMPLGWNMFSLTPETDDSQIVVKLYPDYGSGVDEEDFFALAARGGMTAKRICRFTRKPKKLYLRAVDLPPVVEIKELSMSWVFRRFAIGCMIKKLYGRRDDPRAAESRCSRELLDQIWVIYNKCVVQRFAQISSLDYRVWLGAFGAREGEPIDAEIAAFEFNPLVSVLVPVWNTPPHLLRQCIESVRRQSYSNWQLCLVDDASTDPAVVEILTGYASGDSRIEMLLRTKNGHISAASNSAMELARGEYVALLDHDDELNEDALFEVVKALNEDESLDILYTDEDKLDLKGERTDPHFKSDWNPDLLLAHNYVSHLCVYRRSLIEKAGGFREGVEGAQDYDLLLRCSALTSPERIHHIPKILYHWRAHEGSTALSGERKGYSGPAGRRALENYFVERGLAVKVDFAAESKLLYRVSYPLPRRPLVSLVIPTRDNVGITANCVDSILRISTYRELEILIVDNQSAEPETQEWFEEISKDPRVRVISYDRPFNYSAINNFGVAQTQGEIVGLINNDVEVITPGWLEEMVSLALRPGTGCVGAKLFFRDSRVQHAGVILGLGGCAGHAHRGFSRGSDGYFFRLRVRQNFSAVTGACLLVRREIFDEVGGLDEQLAVAFNDVDFCIRVRDAGYLNVFTPFAELFHFESESRGRDDTPEKAERAKREEDFLKDRWGERLLNDPYYNPNLTLAREDFYLDHERMLERWN